MGARLRCIDRRKSGRYGLIPNLLVYQHLQRQFGIWRKELIASPAQWAFSFERGMMWIEQLVVGACYIMSEGMLTNLTKALIAEGSLAG